MYVLESGQFFKSMYHSLDNFAQWKFLLSGTILVLADTLGRFSGVLLRAGSRAAALLRAPRETRNLANDCELFESRNPILGHMWASLWGSLWG